jgi:hypothetical protein
MTALTVNNKEIICEQTVFRNLIINVQVIPCKQLMRSNHAMALEFLHRLLPQSLPGSILGLSEASPVNILRSLST